MDWNPHRYNRMMREMERTYRIRFQEEIAKGFDRTLDQILAQPVTYNCPKEERLI